MVKSFTTPTTSGSLSFSSVRSLFFSQILAAQLVEHKWKKKMLILWSGSDGLHTASGLALNGGRLDEVPGEVFRVEDVLEWLLPTPRIALSVGWLVRNEICSYFQWEEQQQQEDRRGGGDQASLRHTAWAPEGREGRSQGGPKGRRLDYCWNNC